MKKLFLFLAIVFESQTWAQSNLNLFTEEGEKFTLFLNGIQQNTKPQITINVKNIFDNIQKIRVVFEDKNIQTISQNLYYEIGNEYTYIIRKKNTKVNKVKRIDGKNMNPFVYVLRIQDVKSIKKIKPINSINDNASFIKNDSSVYNNLTINCSPMSDSIFENLKALLKKQGFEDNKVQIIKQVLANNCVSTAQVKSLIKEFSFEENKIRVAKICYSKTTDKENYFTINDAFSFSSSVDEMSEFFKSKGVLNTDGDY